MKVTLTGQFDTRTQDVLHEALQWVQGPVEIDVRYAHMSAGALGELVLLGHRIGPKNITLVNPAPLLKRVLSLTQLKQIVHVRDSEGYAPSQYRQTA